MRVLASRKDVKVGHLRGQDDILDRQLPHQRMINLWVADPLRQTEGGACVSLRVEIDQQNLPLRSCQRGSEIDCGGRLADAPFLVCDR